MGLHAHVCRPANFPDCSLNGISARFPQLCLVNVEGPFEPSDEYPAALLVKGNLPGTLKIIPAHKDYKSMKLQPEWEPIPGWHMFGGNYAAASDSRFGEACRKILGHEFYGAVAIHDRKEA